MVIRRLAALLAAVALVAVALVARDRLHGDDDGTTTGPTGPLTLTCIEELADACRTWAGRHPGVVVRVEAAAATVDAWTALDERAGGPGDPAGDGWLTVAPLPELVDGARRRAARPPVVGEVGAPLARSPLVLVGWNDRLELLRGACAPAPVAWPCLAERAGTPWVDLGGGATWGPVKPGLPAADRSAVGLAVFGQAAAAVAGVADPSSSELADPAVRAGLRRLARAAPSSVAGVGSPLQQALVGGPATYDLVATTEAEARSALGRSARSGQLAMAYPAPMATADVVFAPRRDAPGAGELARLLAEDPPRAELAEAGWRVGDGPDPSGVALEAGTGLPSAGSLEALRALWPELVR